MMEQWLSIDTSELSQALKNAEARLGAKNFQIALRHTIKDTGRKVKTMAKNEIRKEYHAQAGRVGRAIRSPIYTLNGTISCQIPIVDVRGTIATSGAYKPLKRGPSAKIIKSANTVLPHDKKADRIHFYIPSGRLKGHIFVRHNDNRRWTGKRTDRKKKTRLRRGSLTHGVGIGVPQMPMTRAAKEIQKQISLYAVSRLEHYEIQVLNGVITR